MRRSGKLVSALLFFLLLTGITAFPASAQETKPDMKRLSKVFGDYLDEKGIYPLGGELLINYMACSNGWSVFYGNRGGSDAMMQSDRVGNYIFYSFGWNYPYNIGIYAEKDGTVYTLKEAYEAGEIDINAIAASENLKALVFKPGDVDMDGTVALKYVLFVQKVLAKAEEMSRYFSSFSFCDYDGNGVIEISDVLGMQKEIAKMPK